ncbi:MAG: flagellar basal body P-ring protein FlgI [Phycisphaerales bacterium]
MTRPTWRLTTPAALALLAAAVGLSTFGCSEGEQKEARKSEPVLRDVPAIFRGTIASEATLRGIDPVLVSGLGLVVGLNGTGGGPLPPDVMSTMERQLGRGGVGKGGPLDEGPMAGKSPRQVLEDPNVAVVIVEGVVAPGSPDRARFDVRVRTLAGSSVTSLEGGKLWSTDLQLGPPSVFGAMKTRKMAEARGPIFINPFVTPGEEGEIGSSLSRTVGRVLDGGMVIDPLPIELVLDNPSHQRAASIATSINSRFPAGPGDEGPVARGRNASSVAVKVPHAYRNRPAEFIQLVRYMQIDTAFPQEYAKRYADEMLKTPGMANEISWCLQGLGKSAIPFLAGIYDNPEFLPRMAALRAGAKLGDPRTAPFLSEIATSPQTTINLKSECIALLGDLSSSPQADLALREMLSAVELPVRIAAYEALLVRGDPIIRRSAVDGKFWLDTVPAGEPMIYITQQGTPRIVLFGDNLRVNRPALVSAWQDRLMLTADSEGDPPRLYYKDYRTDKVTQGRAPDDVRKLVYYLGHSTTPESPETGLGMTYSEVVGALYEMQRQGAIAGALATEQDRLLARMTELADDSAAGDRPESEAQREQVKRNVRLISASQPKSNAKSGDKKPMLVPLGPPQQSPEQQQKQKSNQPSSAPQ